MADDADNIYGANWQSMLYVVDSIESIAAVSGSADTNTYYFILESTVDGRIWNAGATTPALETYDVAHWPSYAIFGTSPAQNVFKFVLPFALIGDGAFVGKMLERAGASPAVTDPIMQTQFFHPKGRFVANPRGVVIDSSFGGLDALRVIDGAGRGVCGVHVQAARFIGGVRYERANAETDHEGRWSFKGALEPLTEHVLTFERVGFTATALTITTGALV